MLRDTLYGDKETEEFMMESVFNKRNAKMIDQIRHSSFFPDITTQL